MVPVTVPVMVPALVPGSRPTASTTNSAIPYRPIDRPSTELSGREPSFQPMKYHLLGRSGPRVFEICLGTMTFGDGSGWTSDKSESRRVFDTYVDRGGNFLDTANR